jgi:hypothetical protein
MTSEFEPEDHLWMCRGCGSVLKRSELVTQANGYTQLPPCHTYDNRAQLKETRFQSFQIAKFQVWLKRQGIEIPPDVDIFLHQHASETGEAR